MNKIPWIVLTIAFLFAFTGGLFLANGDGASPVNMFIGGNILGAAIMAVVTFHRYIAKFVDHDEAPAERSGPSRERDERQYPSHA